MAITVYGIKNCDTMKKALKWLDEQLQSKISQSSNRHNAD